MDKRFTLKELLLWIIILLIIPVGIYYYETYSYDIYAGTFDKNSPEVKKYLEKYERSLRDGSYPVKYTKLRDGKYVVSGCSSKDFSFFSVSGILGKRLNTIVKSPFYLEGYIPSKEIFSGIDSSKPWFLTRGKDSHHDVTTTEPIVNPMFLISVVEPLSLLDKRMPYYKMAKSGIVDLEQELHKVFLSITSQELVYSPETQVIEHTIPVYCGNLKMLNLWNAEHPYKFALTGLNARDLGYEYVKADKIENIQMLNGVNITNVRYKFKDYYGVKSESPFGEGAEVNQLLPRQPELEFRITKLPALMELTLYKNKNDKSGLKYKIFFEPGLYFTKLPEYSDRWINKDADIVWTNILSRLHLPEEASNTMTLKEIKEFYYDNHEKIEGYPEIVKEGARKI